MHPLVNPNIHISPSITVWAGQSSTMSFKTNPLLCSYCNKVILDPDYLLSCVHLGTISWSLGSLSRVEPSTCPLCKIICMSLQRHH